MGKALMASLVTLGVGIFGCAAFDGWAKAPEIGVVLAVAVMGGMIIMSIEDKKK